MPVTTVHPKVAEAVEFVSLVCGKICAEERDAGELSSNPLVVQWYPDDRITQVRPR